MLLHPDLVAELARVRRAELHRDADTYRLGSPSDNAPRLTLPGFVTLRAPVASGWARRLWSRRHHLPSAVLAERMAVLSGGGPSAGRGR